METDINKLIESLKYPGTVVICSFSTTCYNDGEKKARTVLDLVIKYGKRGCVIVPHRFIHLIPKSWNIENRGMAYADQGINELTYIVSWGLK